MTELFALLLLLEGLSALAAHRNARRFVPLPAALHLPNSRVSVIIPARNEAETIAQCLHSLRAQDYSPYEIIVVDDGSTDDTAAIVAAIAAADPRVQRVAIPKLPPGWAGKVYAMTKGAERARGDYLLFTDADIRYPESVLKRALLYAEGTNLDLVSAVATQTQPSFPWRLATPVGLQLLVGGAAPDGKGGNMALGVGHFMLVKHKAYKRVGGYRSLRASRADDVDLATLIRNTGGRTQMVTGEALIYSPQLSDLKSLWGSWRKSYAAGSKDRWHLMLAGGLIMTLWGLAPWLMLLVGLLKGQTLAALLGLVAWVMQAVARHPFDRLMRVPTRYAPTAPLARLLFGAIALDATLRALRGTGSPWKGRSAPTIPKTTPEPESKTVFW